MAVIAFSTLSWRMNWRQDVRDRFPEWVHSGWLFFDGYGQYAEMMYQATWGDPGPASIHALDEFRKTYQHSGRLLFPALTVAAMIPLGGNLPLAGWFTTVLASIGVVLLLRRSFESMATDAPGAVPWLLAAYLAHLGTLTSFARPMPEPLSLFWLILIGDASLRMMRRGLNATTGLWLIVCMAGGLLTKSVLLLAVAMPAAAYVMGRPDKAVLRTKQLIVIAAAGIPGVVGLVALQADASASAAAHRDAVVSLLGLPFLSLHYWSTVATAGVLMVGLALQVWPVVAVAPLWGKMRDAAMRHPLAVLHAAWVAAYLAQRLLFLGFSLDHSRVRYGVPMVPSMLLAATPGFVQLYRDKPKLAKAMVTALVVGNLAVFALFLIKEAGR